MHGRSKLILVGVLLTLIFGILPNPTLATEDHTVNFSVEVMPSLTVTVSDANIEAAFDQISTTSTRLSVSSNNATGYNTTISTSSASNDLKHTTANYAIPSITESVSKANIPVGHWGFSVDNNTYIAMPTSDNSKQLTEVSQNLPGDTFTDLYFATNIDTSTPSGTYTNSMLITVVPNYTPVSLAESYRLAGKTRVAGNNGRSFYAMQDMSTSICVNADKEESSIQAIDLRDNKIYWITKLKDGNCWMTQNLDFDITEDNVTPELSDVKVAWNSSSTYAPQVTTTTVFNNSSNTGTYSYDPGSKYFPNGAGTPTSITCTSATNNGENCHYHQGNYYQYNAATAGTGGTIANADATSSICPKGWRLPTSNSDSANYSFGNLVKQYGYTGSNQTSGSGVTDSTLLSSPLFFARSGYVLSGSLGHQGSNGRYWSSRAYSDTNDAYRLGFYSSSVYPSNYGNRDNGFSVRCVAHGNILSLTYNANGGTNAPSATIAESNSTSATITIPSTIPTRERYNFLGWATSSTATTPDYVYSNGSFTPSTITVTENQTLYAVWEEAIFYMQDVTSWMDDLELEQQVQAIDTRDNKLYWVAKLKDGNIWMTQNLDYDIKATGNIISNTNGTTSTWSPNTATTTTIFNNESDTGTYSYDPGSNYIPDGTGTPTVITCTSTSNGGENCHYHQGNYYQYNAATAGTGGTITNADATSSICPKGWRLPTSKSADANYSFGNLVKQYGYSGSNQTSGVTDSTLLASPLFFARGGIVTSGSLYYRGSLGYYWSSRAYDNGSLAYSVAYYLYFGSSNVYPSSNFYRYYGFSVRCVAI